MSASKTGETTSSRRGIERSCMLCHRRKVRCDKGQPCSTCSRNNVLCYYPSENQSISRKGKTTIADIAARLVQLERTIVSISSTTAPDEALNGQNSVISHVKSHQEPINESLGSPKASSKVDGRGVASCTADDLETTSAMDVSAHEILVHDAYSSQYINDLLLSRVLQEERGIQSVLASSPEHTTIEDATMPPPSFGLLSMFSRRKPFDTAPKLHQNSQPHQGIAVQLWQRYIQSVDPLSKLLHVPSAQIIVYTAIQDPKATTADVRCLLFAIYFAATTSLSRTEASSLLGINKSSALEQFRAALESAFSDAHVTDKPRMMTLQALAMYLQAARPQNTSRALWVLNGVAIRLAQSIGLHRDGTSFPTVTTFQVELRRRLWWHLITHDSRAAEDHGIAILGADPGDGTRIPLCVDDANLDPTMTALPLDTEGRFTEMTLPVIMYEKTRVMRQLYKLLPGGADLRVTEAVRQDILDRLDARVEHLLKPCNSVIPSHRAVVRMAHMMLRKLKLISRQHWLSVTLPAGSCDRATETSLADACWLLDAGLEMQRDELMRPFYWLWELYPQYQVLLYVLWHLCVKPVGPAMDRAWIVIQEVFALQCKRRPEWLGMNGDEDSEGGSKWMLLVALRDKAERIRKEIGQSKKKAAVEMESAPEWHQREGFESDPDGRHEDNDGTASGMPLLDAFDESMSMDWDGTLINWSSMVEDFNPIGMSMEY